MPIGDWAINHALMARARQEWVDEIERAMPRGTDKSFGVAYVISLLSRLAEES